MAEGLRHMRKKRRLVLEIKWNVDLKRAVGKDYDDFINCRKRYLVCKGSRGSKKSTTTALKFVYDMMYYYFKFGLKPNLLVIRRYMNTNWNSTRAQIVWAINRLSEDCPAVASWWRVPRGEHTITFLPGNQQILFRGMDDPQSITSITVADGNLCWVWIEEAFQITSEDDFNKVDLSIRGAVSAPLYKQFVLTFNPWSDKSWLKKRFFDSPDENTMAMTTTYKMNEFLSEEDVRIYEIMKEKNPRRYKIEGLGEWGVAEGLIYTNWKIEEFDIEAVLAEHRREKTRRGLPNFTAVNGMDFGYNDPTAFIGAWADRNRYKIYIYYEFCEVTMENRKIANRLITDGFGSSIIRADSEDPRTINELRLLGVNGIRGAKKGSGSVLGGIQKLQDYEIIVHPRCTKTVEAFSNYAWKKERLSDKITNEPEHDFSHIPDALRYGCEDLQKFGIMV